MASSATRMAPEMSAVSEPVTIAGIVNPTEHEIATVAYRLWLDSGCSIGADRDHWFRAEAMLRDALVAKREDLSRRPSIPRRRGAGVESEMVAEFTMEQWEGHWEVWEREWGCAR
jgi:hypothetical protein